MPGRRAFTSGILAEGTDERSKEKMEMYSENDPRRHTTHFRTQFEKLQQELRQQVKEVEEPQARCLFETSAEVLEGLQRAFEHYERRSEPAWTKATER